MTSSLSMSTGTPLDSDDSEKDTSSSSSSSSFDVTSYLKGVNVDKFTEALQAVATNVRDGEWGRRGEGYVAAQWVVVGILVLAGGQVPILTDVVMHVVLGPVLLLAGLVTCLLAVTDLGTSLSPWPATNAQTELRTDGLYGAVRHPIYAGLLAACTGLAVTTDSVDRLVWVAVLWYVLELKTDREEDDLVRDFPDDYPAYRNDVPHKFVPNALTNVLPWSNSKKN